MNKNIEIEIRLFQNEIFIGIRDYLACELGTPYACHCDNTLIQGRILNHGNHGIILLDGGARMEERSFWPDTHALASVNALTREFSNQAINASNI